VPETPGGANLGELAMEHYNKAKAYLRQGKWAEYGRELDKLEKILKEMSGKTGE
jgi:flagellin-specific chaperone FliS